VEASSGLFSDPFATKTPYFIQLLIASWKDSRPSYCNMPVNELLHSSVYPSLYGG
jgi:hypothetical protein